MTVPNERTYAFDADRLLSDNAAAYTASGFAQVASANGIVDLGGNQNVTPKQQARIDAVAVVDVTAIDISSGDESYKLLVLGSNAADMGSNCVCLGSTQLGKASHTDVPNAADSVVGRYEVPFTNEQAGTKYQYIAVYLVIAGTSPSISLLGFVAVLPEP